MNLWSLLLTPLLGAAGFPVRLCCLACAPVFTGLGISLAKRSGLGLVPCDILTLIFHERLHRLQFRTVRILYDGAMFHHRTAAGRDHRHRHGPLRAADRPLHPDGGRPAGPGRRKAGGLRRSGRGRRSPPYTSRSRPLPSKITADDFFLLAAAPLIRRCRGFSAPGDAGHAARRRQNGALPAHDRCGPRRFRPGRAADAAVTVRRW